MPLWRRLAAHCIKFVGVARGDALRSAKSSGDGTRTVWIQTQWFNKLRMMLAFVIVYQGFAKS